MSQNEIAAIVTAIIGLVLCFSGFKIQKFLITLAWFGLGFSLANHICANFVDDQTLLIIISLVSGLILGGIGYKLEKLALMIAVTYLTYITIGPFVTASTAAMEFMIEGGISLIVGVLSTLFIKEVLIFVSAIAGAALIKQAIPVFFDLKEVIVYVIAGVIAVTGIIYQLKTA